MSSEGEGRRRRRCFLADHLPANGQRALQRNAPWSSDVSPTDWSRGLPPSAPTITVTNIVTCPAREKSVDDVAVFLADHLPANGQRALQRNAPWSSDVSPTDWSRGLPPSAPIENDDEPTADGSHDSPRRIERCPSMALQPRRHRAFAVDGVERQTTSTICTEEVASQTTSSICLQMVARALRSKDPTPADVAAAGNVVAER